MHCLAYMLHSHVYSSDTWQTCNRASCLAECAMAMIAVPEQDRLVGLDDCHCP